jgi:N-acyl-D-aspartate/D-glutamate deacylase
VRAELDRRANSEEAGFFRFFAAWDRLLIDETFAPENQAFRGRTVGDVARSLGKTPFDTFLDVALADDLRTSFMPQMPGDDADTWRLRAEVWKDPRTIIGASDAGAHLDMIDTFSLSTALLGSGVRKHGILSFEEAIHHITEVPSRLYGLKERGRIADGFRADLVVFDPDRVQPGPVHTRNDLPGGAARLYAEAEGIEHVLVNGVEIIRGQSATGAFPGTVLRSGRDTETVTAR